MNPLLFAVMCVVASLLSPAVWADARLAVPNAFTSTQVTVLPATVNGPVSAQTISAAIIPADSDVGQGGSIFVVALLPASQRNRVYFMDNTSRWMPYTDCTTAPAYFSGALSALGTIPVIATPLDLSALAGTMIYLGYGTGGTSSPSGTACNNMLKNALFGLAYTIPAAAAPCVYALTPSNQSFGASGGNGNITVQPTTSGCTAQQWTAVSNSAWITSVSIYGNSNVSYYVSSNSSTSQRSGTITVAGVAFSVTQSGATPYTPPPTTPTTTPTYYYY